MLRVAWAEIRGGNPQFGRWGTYQMSPPPPTISERLVTNMYTRITLPRVWEIDPKHFVEGKKSVRVRPLRSATFFRPGAASWHACNFFVSLLACLLVREVGDVRGYLYSVLENWPKILKQEKKVSEPPPPPPPLVFRRLVTLTIILVPEAIDENQHLGLLYNTYCF